jgi:hypothetical protein
MSRRFECPVEAEKWYYNELAGNHAEQAWPHRDGPQQQNKDPLKET